MKGVTIPVRVTPDVVLRPPSSPSDGFPHLPFPFDAPAFSMPQPPQDADAAALAASRALLDRFADEMDGGSPRVDALRLDGAVRRVLEQSLGEGEVLIWIELPDGEVRIQETVFAGIWRERHFDGEGLRQDWLSACAIPPLAVERAQQASTTQLAPLAMPAGAMNAPALLAELRAQLARWHPRRAPHVINLTLLPLTPDDHAVLAQAAPAGPVAILSRGFGNCRISSTRLRNVWRVQYFNSMQTLILNTLEVVEVPEVALAADEDLADSGRRLRELVQWMGETA